MHNKTNTCKITQTEMTKIGVRTSVRVKMKNIRLIQFQCLQCLLPWQCNRFGQDSVAVLLNIYGTYSKKTHHMLEQNLKHLTG